MDKRTILAFILIAVVIIFWDDYLRLMGIAPKESETKTEFVQTEDSGTKTKGTEEGLQQRQTPVNAEIRANPGDGAAPSSSENAFVESTVDADWMRRNVVIETDFYRARLTNNGAGLVSFILKKNNSYLTEEVQMIPDGALPRPAFRFWTYAGPYDTDQLKFKLLLDENTKRIKLSPGQERKLEFVATVAGEGQLSVIYTFTGDGYSFFYETQTKNLDNYWVRPEVEAYWRGGLAYTEPDTAQDQYYSKGYVYYGGNVLEKIKINTKKNVSEGPTNGETHWAAVRTKYFIAALVPENSLATGAWMESVVDSNYRGKHFRNRLGVGIKMPFIQGAPVTPIRVYMGPLDDGILSSIDPTLKRAMTLGVGVGFFDTIISPIAKFLLWALKALHGIIPNYGICIIIFSILIKVVIWPLTRKSYQSMSAMQRIQPRLQELKAKHQGDPQKLQTETMKLYKEEKVNPAGGCLPVLLQMPLLYALFIVFRSTIEIRRAPFIFWIKDLSMPDTIINLPFTLPLYGDQVALLPLVMGVTSFFQSKMTMSNDPNQKMMLYFMPIFLTLIFNSFPSGLTLYYTLFNVWTIVQQKMTPPPTAAVNYDAKSLPKK